MTHTSKIKSIENIKAIISKNRALNNHYKIGFTNGCFDLIHLGHLQYLREAKADVDCLVVGLNSDSSVSSLKGAGRPINNEIERASFLEFLSFVDYIIVFTEPTPEKIIEALSPDVIFKGGDYQEDNVVGANFVRKNGGKVILASFLEGYSTTNLIKKIKGTE
ncbi:D-glycero-beta-D-manno-heptose 1-phosphate adenylyltransferase [Planktomarina temperata]|nr:D-glycero-beta-D-manno-heptose 1-phosphate adenylyltransferase [Planktomarina temperata]